MNEDLSGHMGNEPSADRRPDSPGQELPDHPDLSLTLPARAENVAVVRHAIGGLGEALEIDDQTLSDVKLAVTEACTNAVVHAYPDGDGPLEVAAYVRDDRLMLVVRDEGRGIMPRTDSPGLGLGLPLIATLAEALELGTDDEERTEVRMTFRLIPEDVPA
jgi:anti-sigma regulatory factor (Ser/Thr protein kinase)